MFVRIQEASYEDRNHLGVQDRQKGKLDTPEVPDAVERVKVWLGARPARILARVVLW